MVVPPLPVWPGSSVGERGSGQGTQESEFTGKMELQAVKDPGICQPLVVFHVARAEAAFPGMLEGNWSASGAHRNRTSVPVGCWS